jgi:hypothetical protein
MIGSAMTKLNDLVRAQGQLRQHIQGRLPGGPFDALEDLTFELPAEENDTAPVKALRLAVKRDGRHATACAPYLRAHALGSGVREVYGRAIDLLRGGAE